MCGVVALDVANAFNSAKWPKIIEAMRVKEFPPYLVGMVQSYLYDQTVEYEGSSRTSTCGVPQGSVLGPLLWNIMYDYIDEVLRVNMGGNVDRRSSTELVAFVDDVAVVSTGLTSSILETITNNALSIVSDWINLTGNPNKERDCSLPELAIKGTRIEIKNQIKYLGLEFHRVLGFKKHVDTAAAKAQITSLGLARLISNVGCSGQRNRKLLFKVVGSKLLYASPIWTKSLVFNGNVVT